MGIQTASQAYTNEGLGGFSFRNKIINGAMEIDQRNAGAEVNPATHNGYQLDRWTTFMDVSNKFKVQQLTTSPPAGFTHYMRLTVTNACIFCAKCAIYTQIGFLCAKELIQQTLRNWKLFQFVYFCNRRRHLSKNCSPDFFNDFTNNYNLPKL